LGIIFRAIVMSMQGAKSKAQFLPCKKTKRLS